MSKLTKSIKKSLKRTEELIFTQKCIPWRVHIKYGELKAYLCNTNTKKYWDKIWYKETFNPSERRFYPAMYSKISSLVSENSLILDVGCGMGILMQKLIIEKRCRVIGIDLSEEAIRHILSKGMIGITAKVPPLPFPPDCFDYVIATEFLEHLKYPGKALKEFLRVLKIGGHYIVSVPEYAGPEINKEHLKSYDKITLNKLLHIFFNDVNIVSVKEDFESHPLIIGYGTKLNK